MEANKLRLKKRLIARLNPTQLETIQAGQQVTPGGRTTGRDCTYINCPGPDTF